MKTILILLLLVARPLAAQVTDSLVQYCPPASIAGTSTGDTVVVIPQGYKISVGQTARLKAIQCGYQKVRDVSRLKGVKWVSSDPTVIKVSATGIATALKSGNVVISATYP